MMIIDVVFTLSLFIGTWVWIWVAYLSQPKRPSIYDQLPDLIAAEFEKKIREEDRDFLLNSRKIELSSNRSQMSRHGYWEKKRVSVRMDDILSALLEKTGLEVHYQPQRPEKIKLVSTKTTKKGLFK